MKGGEASFIPFENYSIIQVFKAEDICQDL